MSLLDAAERFAAIDRSQILLDAGRCLHSYDQVSECSSCYEVCPVSAITAGKPPVLDTEHCQSCLACLPVCPVGAYRGDDDVADLLKCATHVEDPVVEILCGPHPHPEAGLGQDVVGIQIRGCLAGLGTGAYLTLSTLGTKRVLSRTDNCRDCKWGALHSRIQDQAVRANRFLSAWDLEEVVNCVSDIGSPVERPHWNAKNPPLSRRDLFRMMARQGQVAMARAMENGVSAAEHKPGRDRLRLLSAVAHLPDPQTHGSWEVVDGLNFATLSVSEACTACGACSKACPTQALKLIRDEEAMTFSLSFIPQNCIGCDLCDHVCMPDAIHLNHSPAFEEVLGTREPVIAASGGMVRCEHCRSWIAKRDGVRLCSLCEYRRTHPFGSLIPKKAVRGTRS